MFGSLKALFYGGTKGFRPYEKQCLDWFGEHLPEKARKSLQTQIGRIVVIQRSMRDQEVDCHFAGKAVSDDVPFENAGLELHAGRVVLRAPNHSQIACDIFVSEAFLDRLVYHVSPKLWRDADFSLERVEIFTDLTKPDARERKPAEGNASLPQKLQGQNVRDLAEPATESEIEKLVHRLGNCLPGDYADLLRASDGFALYYWTVLGLHTWTRAFDDVGVCTWLAGGETLGTDPRGLVILHRDTEPKVYLRDEVNHEFTDMGSSFIDALLQVALGEFEDEPYESPEDDAGSWPRAPKA